MKHEIEVRKILSAVTPSGNLRSRESNTVEFKESFNKNSTAKYAKTMAAYANNRGGYIIFGVKDNPREIVGLKSNNFENLSQEQFTDAINSLFSPAIDWECGTLTIPAEQVKTVSNENLEKEIIEIKIGWFYAEQAENKPVIAQNLTVEKKSPVGMCFIDTGLGVKK